MTVFHLASSSRQLLVCWNTEGKNHRQTCPRLYTETEQPKYGTTEEEDETTTTKTMATTTAKTTTTTTTMTAATTSMMTTTTTPIAATTTTTTTTTTTITVATLIAISIVDWSCSVCGKDLQTLPYSKPKHLELMCRSPYSWNGDDSQLSPCRTRAEGDFNTMPFLLCVSAVGSRGCRN